MNFQEAIVTSEEIGKDYEHVEAQQKKFDDFEKVGWNGGHLAFKSFTLLSQQIVWF